MNKLPDVGDTLAGKYRLEARLGEGGMGVVYRAEHLKMRRKVAIKLLQPSAMDDPESIARFQREARAAGQLESPHVAKILDVEEIDGLHYMVMELLEGHDLEHELTTRGRIPVEEAIDYVLQACEAISEAHAQGIVHRDLKPSNLFLARDRHGQVSVKLLDFGISKIQSDAQVKLTAANASMGTPLYMSPEQVRAAATVGPETDQWSLGIILFELTAGRAPFLGGSATAVAASIVADPLPRLLAVSPDLPVELEEVLTKVLEKDPRARFASVDELGRELRAVSRRIPSMIAMNDPLARTQKDVSRAVSIRAHPLEATATGGPTTRSTQRAQPSRGRAWMWGAALVVVGGGAAAAFVATRDLGHRETLAPSANAAAEPRPTAAPEKSAAPEPPPVLSPSEPTAASAPIATGSAPLASSIAVAASDAPARPTTTRPPTKPAHTAATAILPPPAKTQPVAKPPPRVENPDRL